MANIKKPPLDSLTETALKFASQNTPETVQNAPKSIKKIMKRNTH